MAYLEDSISTSSSELNALAKLPSVLMIGDSIRIGYTPFVKEMLSDVIDVKAPAENCRYTQNGIVSLEGRCSLVSSPAAV